MKLLIRLFFKTLRAVLGPFLLLGDWLTRPKGIVRPETEQHAVDARTRDLALYHFPTCPFCLKTRRVMRRLSLDIELRDAKNDKAHRAALVDPRCRRDRRVEAAGQQRDGRAAHCAVTVTAAERDMLTSFRCCSASTRCRAC